MVSKILRNLTAHDRKVLCAFVDRIKGVCDARDMKVYEALEVVSKELHIRRAPDAKSYMARS